MKVKCLKHVYSFAGELMYKEGDNYDVSIYKDMLSAQTRQMLPYPGVSNDCV
ncbi:hypothetical protein SAMN04487895_101671 [Paenibacillus sophorae]|uniref:Uncharacterized protein n=1 Tax=Paenibacillus sophorae TaxID=1333845 RepID=A0A1H8GYU5_9BACL|nr:hypothetical protein SAMN04487895_101671 [Paenibacillus sophorae]